MIGALIRTTMIIFGMGAIMIHSVVGVVSLVVWAVIPLLPFVGIILFTTGWLPWSL